MARPLRITLIGGWYHITARGNERRDIFKDDSDRDHFLSLLAEMVAQFHFILHAYVLMKNHYHLIMEITEENISRGIQWLNVSYSQWFNRRHQRVGHLFQGRFKSILMDQERWGLELSRYVHLNPIRVQRLALSKGERQRHRQRVGRAAGEEVLKARIRMLQKYRWSSYGAYVGREKCPEWLTCEELLARWGGKKEERQRAYQSYTEKAIWEGGNPSPWQDLEGQVVLASREFVDQLQELLKGDEQEQSGLKRLKGRPAWEKAVAVVEKMKGERWDEFRDRYGDWGRDVALWLGRRWCGMKLTELSQAVGVRHYASVGTAIKYLQRRSQTDRQLAKIMRQAQNTLLNTE